MKLRCSAAVLSTWLALALVFLGLAPSSPAGAFHSSGGPGVAVTNSAAALARRILNVRQIGPDTFRLGGIEFNKAQRTLSIPAQVRMRKDVVEYGLVTEQGKAYESLLTTTARPMDIHTASILLGHGQAPLTGELNKPAIVPDTNSVLVEVTWETNGQPMRVPFSDLVCLTAGRPDTNAPPMKTERWLYNGSVIDQAGFAAEREGSLISLIRDPVALVNNPAADRDNDDIHFPNTRLLPPEGTPVTVVIRFLKSAQPK